MRRPNLARQLKSQQTKWAVDVRLSFDDAGYCHILEENLPWLTSATRADFAAADGNEFAADGLRSKIAALHSSSALAVNVFDYWRTRDASALAQVLGLEDEIKGIRFEEKFKTGVGSRSPNLDVVIRTGTSLLAIESKFTEPFTARKKSGVQDKYVPTSVRLWAAHGLNGAQRAVEALRNGESFTYVDAAQLLKHMLGLAQCGRDWHLLLLWYAPSPTVGSEMMEEAARFRSLLASDAPRFTHRTYQDFWSELRPHLSAEHAQYATYIERRYFPQRV